MVTICFNIFNDYSFLSCHFTRSFFFVYFHIRRIISKQMKQIFYFAIFDDFCECSRKWPVLLAAEFKAAFESIDAASVMRIVKLNITVRIVVASSHHFFVDGFTKSIFRLFRRICPHYRPSFLL